MADGLLSAVHGKISEVFAPARNFAGLPELPPRPSRFAPREERQAWRALRDVRRAAADDLAFVRSDAAAAGGVDDVRARDFDRQARLAEKAAADARAKGNEALAVRHEATAAELRKDAESARTEGAARLRQAESMAERSARENVELQRKEYDKLLKERATRRAKLLGRLRYGLAGLAAVGTGVLATRALNTYVDAQVAAAAGGASGEDLRVADLTRRLASGEQLSADESRELTEAIGPELFQGLLDLGASARESGSSVADDPEVEDEIGKSIDESAEVERMGADTSTFAGQAASDAELEVEAGEFPDGPFDKEFFDELNAIDPAAAQRYVTSTLPPELQELGAEGDIPAQGAQEDIPAPGEASLGGLFSPAFAGETAPGFDQDIYFGLQRVNPAAAAAYASQFTENPIDPMQLGDLLQRDPLAAADLLRSADIDPADILDEEQMRAVAAAEAAQPPQIDDGAPLSREEALFRAEAEMEQGYTSGRDRLLDSIGLGGTADRLADGGPFVDPDSRLGRLNEFIQSNNPLGGIADQQREATPGRVNPYAALAGAGDWFVRQLDPNTWAEGVDATGQDLYTIGEVTGANDEMGRLLGPIGRLDARQDLDPSSAAPNLADQQRVDDEFEAFNAQERALNPGAGPGMSERTPAFAADQAARPGRMPAADAEERARIDAFDAYAVPPYVGTPTTPPAPAGLPRIVADGIRVPGPVGLPATPVMPRMPGVPADGGLPPMAGAAEASEAADETGFLPPALDVEDEQARAAAREDLRRADETMSPRGQMTPPPSAPEPSAPEPPAAPGAVTPMPAQVGAAAPGGTPGDFNNSRGTIDAGLDADYEQAEEELNRINRFMRDRMGLDASQRRSAAAALINFGGALASTPGNFLQGFAQAGVAGLEGFRDEEDRQTAEEDRAYQRQRDADADRRADAMFALRAQELAQRTGISQREAEIQLRRLDLEGRMLDIELDRLENPPPEPLEISRDVQEYYDWVDAFVAQGASLEEARQRALEQVSGGSNELVAAIAAGLGR